MKGYIYFIKVNEMTYVGSTTDFYARKKKHQYNIKKGKQRLYQEIRNNDNKYSMYFISVKQYENMRDLRIEEERIREQFNCDLNMIKCSK